MALPIGMITAGLGAATAAKNLLGIGNSGKKQLEQQEKLNKQQIEGSKELSEYQRQQQMKMWEDTNYKPQVDQIKKAGLNPALLYGTSGGGGATVGGGGMAISGGQAANEAATTQAETGQAGILGMMGAQLRVLESQANKNDAEAENLRGVARDKTGAEAAESGARKAGIEFQNEVNKRIGAQSMADNYQWASDKIAIESQKTNAEYESWKAAGFAGKTFDDPTSPLAKAMRAGLETTVQQLEKAKLENNAQAATNVVKNFEADLAEQGIHPNSPWWTKLITDVLTKVGITDVIGMGEKATKGAVKQGVQAIKKM